MTANGTLPPMPGPATTLLLLPGMASDAALWRHQWPVLQAQPGLDVRVADAHARFATLPEMGAALWDENPGELLLAGTSMGGILALEMWQQAPHRVKGLALLGSSARPDTPELIALRTQACELFAAGRMDEVLRVNLMFAFHADSLREQPGLAEAYLAMMARAGPGQLIRQNRAIMARPDRRPMLRGLACPTLVVCGDSDQLTPPEASRELAHGIPGAQLHLLPRCGHLLTWEQPAAVNRLLLQWLARALGG